MSKKFVVSFSLVFAFFVLIQVGASAQQSENPVSENLFQSRNLADWDAHFAEPNTKVADVYSFNDDGVLICKGEPFGYIATKKEYRNFKIAVEYRWPGGVKPTNSGIFLRINKQDKDSFLPRGLETQLAHQSAGDLWGFHGMKIAGPKERLSERENPKIGPISGVKRIQEAEREPGQWNSVEVLCCEGLVVICVNGKIVNWTSDAETTPGKIGLQSEGGMIHFRNCVLTPLP